MELRDRTRKTGFRTKTVEVTNIDIPPIVLIPMKIGSASDALKEALLKKEQSVKQAIRVRNMQDQADNQEPLAKATVANAAAEQTASQIKKLADAEEYRQNTIADAAKYKIESQAAALSALANVIGPNRAADLMIQETINEAAEKFNVPQVYVNGSSGSDAQGIVGAHMVSQAIMQSLKAQNEAYKTEKPPAK